MKPAQRRIRENLLRGETSYGVAVQLASPDIVEIVGYTGYDFAWIDAEHGGFDLGDLRDLIRAADAARIDSIVRVPNHEETFIQRVLDLGASGVMVPKVSTVEQGKAVVAATRFAPAGTRGACPCGRAFGHRTQNWSSEYRQADEDVLVFAIIEDRAGVANVEAIASECGFDGLLFGPFDLSMELGLEGNVQHPDLLAMRALLQRLAAVTGRLSLCADQAAAAKWWLSMSMASVSAE
ncbi:HpcH/HpaI aldolase family protein, partial [Sphingomonas sp. Root710]|uniref:HpcH/HpaI aldolase family protein n=1 Tax=Sphingomonas sp. Root710 TaxID=1736594 RepID=UPI0039E02A0E